ncbi:MAG: hypothetical protein J6K19_09295, partial [Prevotella sp.]|nr:hypothetical protein [Prevotella sp.]
CTTTSLLFSLSKISYLSALRASTLKADAKVRSFRQTAKLSKEKIREKRKKFTFVYKERTKGKGTHYII